MVPKAKWWELEGAALKIQFGDPRAEHPCKKANGKTAKLVLG